MKTLLLIDGNAIMHRAYHALPPFSTKSGIPTNVIYGFFGMIHRAILDFEPSHVVICFDTPKPTFRQELSESYQAHRPAMADDFKSQIPILMELIDASGLTRCAKDGFEADDLIGTLATDAYQDGMKTLILTGDKDIMQLVNERTFVIAPINGASKIKLYDTAEVKNKLGVPPARIPDYKALAGDPSDNYTGAKGIGPKTTIKLLETYKSIDDLYKHLDEIEDGKVKQKLIDHKDNVLLSLKLATIVRDMDTGCDLEKAEFSGFPQTLKDHLQKYEMRSLLTRLFDQPIKIKKEVSIKEKSKLKKEEKNKDQLGMF